MEGFGLWNMELLLHEALQISGSKGFQQNDDLPIFRLQSIVTDVPVVSRPFVQIHLHLQCCHFACWSEAKQIIHVFDENLSQ